MKLEDTNKIDKLYFASIQSETAIKFLNLKLRTPPLKGVIITENGGTPKVGVDAVKALKPYIRKRWTFLTFMFSEKMYMFIAKYRHLLGKVDRDSCPFSKDYSNRILP
jgi:predicted DCC family thiol-disulfide oxidoreductase YuxK